MKILHGTWIPSSSDEFIQAGNFYLWVETDEPPKQQKNQETNRHPQQLNKDDISTFLSEELGINPKNGVEIDLISDLDLCRSLSLHYPNNPSINRYKLCLEIVSVKLRLYISIDINDQKPLT
jgi:hypothetical protein